MKKKTQDNGLELPIPSNNIVCANPTLVPQCDV